MFFSDINNYVYFHDVLFAATKRVYGNWVHDHLKPETHEFLAKIEVKTKRKLDKIRKKIKRQENRRFFHSSTNKIMNDPSLSNNNGDSVQSPGNSQIKKNKNVANPLMRMLLLGLIWKSWNTFSIKKLNNQNIEEDEEEYESDDSQKSFSQGK